MSNTYIIEVGSKTAGIVVRNPEGYRFFRATPRFNALEGQLFRNAREAERAAVRLANGNLEPGASLPQPRVDSDFSIGPHSRLCRARSERGGPSGQKFPVRALFLP